MAANNDNDDFVRPRRSSFVAASQDNEDFVPVLPPVGSAPIPAASDVNYFPTVETGHPGLREPSPPARLVVPTRKSMTEEEIATAFVDAADMTSAEQIAMLDAQVTLRQDDLRTAREFVDVLRTANRAEAIGLLAELKREFADVDEEIARLSLGDDVAVEPIVVAPGVGLASDNAAVESTLAEPAPELPGLPVSTPTPITPAQSEEPTPSGRYRGWSVVITIAAMFASLVPVTSAIFTPYGAPLVDAVPDLIGSNGIIVVLLTMLVALPLIVLARSVPAKNGLSVSGALARVAGPFGGATLTIIASIAVAVGFLSILVTTSQGVGLQLSSIPGVTSTLAGIAPQAHVTVLVVAVLVVLGFIIAALPRPLFRAKVLALAGFTLVGPAIVLATGLAVVANTASGAATSLTTAAIAMGIVPTVVLVVAGGESGVATVLRRDDVKLHGLWLYVGITLGIGFAAWALVARMGSDPAGSVFVGSNPALHLVAPSTELAFVLGAVAFSVPVIFLSALIGRSIMMSVVRDDRANGPVWFRVIVIAIPLALAVIDFTAVAGDVTAVLPGIQFASIPVMALVGTLAGASVLPRRERAGWAHIVTTVVTLLVTVVGLAAASWAVPSLSTVFDTAIAPFTTSLGLSGATLLVVPTGALVVSFVVSLIVSSLGSVRPDRNA
jgi:hypothetical protein